MKSVKPSNEMYATDTTLEQENQLIAEAKHLLYARLKTRDQVFTSPSATRDYLHLQLSERQQEVRSEERRVGKEWRLRRTPDI